MISNSELLHEDALSSLAAASRSFRPGLVSSGITALMRARGKELDGDELVRSAMFFSPHPDDECLGCGGTILKKKQAGAYVSLVHMTDGSGSHAHAMSRQQLKALRRAEAERAAQALHVDDTFFLDFEDGRLNENIDQAAERVLTLLNKQAPDEVFIPSRLEPARQALDHLATTSIVKKALAGYAKKIAVWEYPIWFYLHWPWVSLRQTSCKAIRTRHVVKNSLKLAWGLRALSEFEYSIDITSALKGKMAALAEHRTQLVELLPGVEWATLAQVSSGEFLRCFLADREFFHRSSY